MAEPSGPHRVLLTEATSASAREVLTVLGGLGYRVGVLDGGGVSFTRGSRWVARRHRVPPFAAGPLRWLDSLAGVLRGNAYDVLLPTHEQLVALSAHRERFAALVPGLAVPPFAAVRRVLDKAATVWLLAGADLAQPETVVLATAAELSGHADLLPGYVKLPVATASRGVWPVRDAAELRRVAALPVVAGAGPVLLQRAVAGPVAMISAIFDNGRLTAAHTAIRRRDGVQGGAAAKESIRLPAVERDLSTLGRVLAWHGPLSADAVLVGARRDPHYVDLNPRLVEPVNGQLAGARLVEQWLRVSAGEPVAAVAPGAAGIRTHALLLAVLGAAASGGGRRAVLGELARAATGRGWYAHSAEELTPAADPLSLVPLGLAAAVLLGRPALWSRLAGTATPPHALTAAGWRQLLTSVL